VSGALRHPADEPVDDGTATGPAADAGSPDVPPAGPPPGSTDPKLVQYERWFRRLDTQLRMLDRERQKFLAVVNRTDADVFVADPARRIIWTNRGLSKRPSPVAGRPWTGLLCSDFCSHMAGKACGESPADCAVARCLAENAAAHVELHRGGPAGSRELLLSALPIVGPTGSAEEAVVLVQDLTNLEVVRRLAHVLDHAPLVLFSLDRNGRFTLSEGRGLDQLGLRPGEVVGRSVYDVYADHPEVLASVRRALTGEEFRETTVVGALAFETWFSPLRNAAGEPDGVFGVATDVTRSRRLELQLLHSQKMEAIGRLAGGVAHDFNNLLTIMLGHCELMIRKVPADSPLAREAEAVLNAGRRGADLARQLLAFSRKQLVEPTVFDAGQVLRELDGMLRRLIPEDIDLVTVIEDHPASIRADRGQVEQLVMNLVVNARDAMPTGGKITIELGIVTVDPSWLPDHPTLQPGPHVRLVVSDTGRGMDEETRLQVFEPFFTTKETGRGTGLGLSIVYGVVKQLGGDIQVYSELGVGSSFKVYLPRVPGAAETETDDAPGLRLTPGAGTILLAEDEDELRELAKEILETSGYEVLATANGAEALERAAAHVGPIDLLLTDVVMPGLSGGELARRLRAVRPDTRVLYMSGYPDDAIVRHGVLDAAEAFLQKPFSVVDLAERVRRAIG
jgi:two-component system cell cycle sensor histidine kinase/response regulator CckA